MGSGAADLSAAQVAEPAMDDSQVVAFLKANPDFLARHPELFEVLELRHASGAAVSLIERQVEILRGKSGRLEDRLKTLLDAARDNESRAANVHRLARSLIRAPTLAATVAALRKCLREELMSAGAAGAMTCLPRFVRSASAAVPANAVFPTIFIQLRGGWDRCYHFAARTGMATRGVTAVTHLQVAANALASGNQSHRRFAPRMEAADSAPANAAPATPAVARSAPVRKRPSTCVCARNGTR